MPDKTPDKTPKIPSFEEAQADMGEGPMSFLMDMVRQDEPPEGSED
jgi:hypothetical protein